VEYFIGLILREQFLNANWVMPYFEHAMSLGKGSRIVICQVKEAGPRFDNKLSVQAQCYVAQKHILGFTWGPMALGTRQREWPDFPLKVAALEQLTLRCLSPLRKT
jgi:hypothetical protein